MRERSSGSIAGGPVLVIADEERKGSVLSWDASGSFADRTQFDGAGKEFSYLVIDPLPFTIYVKKSLAVGDWSPGQVIKASPAQTTEDAQNAALAASAERARAETAATQAATYNETYMNARDTAVAKAIEATSAAAAAVASRDTANNAAVVAVASRDTAVSAKNAAQASNAEAYTNAQSASSSRQAAQTAQTAAASSATSADNSRGVAQTQASQASASAATSGAARDVAITKASEASTSAANAASYAAAIGMQIFDFSFDSEASPTDDWSN